MSKQTAVKLTNELAAQHPQPGNDPVQRLRHTVEMFASAKPDEYAILATSNLYGPGVKTGLTWRDLAALLRIVAKK
jgi:hypothetical protein